MADLHQRVTIVEERTQAHDTGIGELRKDIAALRTDIAVAREEMVHRSDVLEIRGEMADVRSELSHIRGEMVHRSDLADLRHDMNQRFAAIDQKFIWVIGIQFASLVAVIGALVGSYYR